MMNSLSFRRVSIAAALAAGVATLAPAAVWAQPAAATRPANDVTLSVGAGRMVQLDSAMSDLFVANDAIADVQVRSPNQIYIFGKGAGETTVYATNRAGRVVYSANVRVGTNIGSVDEMLRIAMPEANIRATPMNGIVLLTGTVAAPADVEEAGRLVQAFVGETTQVVSRLRTATPQQVMLKAKVVEVNRSLLKRIGVNLQGVDLTGGFNLSFATGRDFINNDGQIVYPEGTNSFNLFGNLLGIDVASAVDLNENGNLVTVLAEPTLVALSGETASFLAGGQFPIVTTSGLSGPQVEFKDYGVSLAFSPTVLEGGRISMRVRPEVSELTSEGAVTISGFAVPALIVRNAETTVELGSGQSFMIGGLLRNSSNNTVDKVPWLGDVPILGSLFRSTNFRRNETELVIIVTPYLVKPVNASQIALPTDGFRVPDDGKRVFLDQRNDGRSGEQRPTPWVAPAPGQTPGFVTGSAVAPALPVAPQRPQTSQAAPAAASAQPGFSF